MHLDAPEVVQLDHTVHVNISQWSSPGHMEPSKHGASGEHFKWVNFYGKQQHFHLYFFQMLNVPLHLGHL